MTDLQVSVDDGFIIWIFPNTAKINAEHLYYSHFCIAILQFKKHKQAHFIAPLRLPKAVKDEPFGGNLKEQLLEQDSP